MKGKIQAVSGIRAKKKINLPRMWCRDVWAFRALGYYYGVA